jgi:hypothetical protein
MALNGSRGCDTTQCLSRDQPSMMPVKHANEGVLAQRLAAADQWSRAVKEPLTQQGPSKLG